MGKSVCAKHEVAYEVECPYCEPAEASDRDWAAGVPQAEYKFATRYQDLTIWPFMHSGGYFKGFVPK